MALTKKQFLFIGSIAFIIFLGISVWAIQKRYSKTGADEVGYQTIKSIASATYEVGGNTYTVDSSALDIKYTNVEMPVIESINLEEGQVVDKNPYFILVKATKPEDISKIEFYVDEVQIGISTLPDVDGYFECLWDTYKYHSLVKIVVFDNFGRSATYTRSVVVDIGSVQPIDGPVNGSSTSTKPIQWILPRTGSE